MDSFDQSIDQFLNKYINLTLGRGGEREIEI